MGLRRLMVLPNFQGAQANQTATLDLPKWGKYHNIQLTYTTSTVGGANQANIEAEITEIRIKVNGVVQRVFSSAQLFVINAFYGVGFSTGLLPIFFSEPWMRTVLGEEAIGWGTGDVQTFTLEVDIAAGAGVTGLSAVAEIDLADKSPMGQVVLWKRYVPQVAGVGVLNYPNLPRGTVARPVAYKALHFIEQTAADISDVLVKIDANDVFDATFAQATQLYAFAGFTMQPAMFTVSPYAMSGQIGQMWPMISPGSNPPSLVQSFEVNLNMAVAANPTLIAESLGYRD